GHDVITLDRTDETSLKVVGQLDIPELNAVGAQLVGTLLYVSGQEGGLAVVDMFDPLHPRKIAYTPSTAGGRGRDVVISGNIAAVAQMSAGVALFDLTDPRAPKYLGNQPTEGHAYTAGFINGAMVVQQETSTEVFADVAA